MAEAVFALDADAGGVVDGSAAAADALEKLKAGIEKDQAALKELTAQMKLLQSGGAVNVAQFKQLKEQIDAKKGSIQKASSIHSRSIAPPPASPAPTKSMIGWNIPWMIPRSAAPSVVLESKSSTRSESGCSIDSKSRSSNRLPNTWLARSPIDASDSFILSEVVRDRLGVELVSLDLGAKR